MERNNQRKGGGGKIKYRKKEVGCYNYGKEEQRFQKRCEEDKIGLNEIEKKGWV